MKPYLSIVVTSRNDDHGGDALKRMNIFMRGLIHQTRKFGLPCELVFVEWNPPRERPLLHEILPKPQENDFLTVKFIQVPFAYHEKLGYHEKLYLFQMIAKNVGIRRSSAEFVLCTNIDLLFSDDLMLLLGKRNLKEGFFYRANRCDIPSDIPEQYTTEKQLLFCKENIIRRIGLDPEKEYDPYRYSHSAIFKNPWLKPLALYYKRRFWKNPISADHRIMMLDLEACGDFTLMHKNDWLRINGYFELEMYSLHIDSIALMAADSIGLKQVTFPPQACTYHIDHSDGWMNYDPLNKIRFYEKKPTLDWYAVTELGKEMMDSKQALTINKEDWGLKNENLQEIVYPSGF